MPSDYSYIFSYTGKPETVMRILKYILIIMGIFFMAMAIVIFIPDKEDTITLIVIGIAGFILLSIGFGMIIYGRIRGSTIKRLEEFGLRIETQFDVVEINNKLTINGENPYRIVSRYTKDERRYSFRSKHIWSNPEPRIRKLGIDKITVLVDPNNMRKYYMDISFLKEPWVPFKLT